jgi:hypothetical protein
MSAPLTSAAFTVLADLLKARSGLIIGQDKIYLLETRLVTLLRRSNWPTSTHWPIAWGGPGLSRWLAKWSRR